MKVGDKVEVLRKGYSPSDTEDMTVMTIENIWIYQVCLKGLEVVTCCAMVPCYDL